MPDYISQPNIKKWNELSQIKVIKYKTLRNPDCSVVDLD